MAARPLKTDALTVRKPRLVGRIVAGGMLRENTPLEYYPQYNIFVKREDKACVPPGPPFSKARGVYSRILSRSETLIGALDTRHSQAGHAVARACQVLGKQCVNFYPQLKYEPEPKYAQLKAQELGAELYGLKGWAMGPQQVLFHIAKKIITERGGYMMPNALTMEESIVETARECPTDQKFDWVLISASSGTIAAGVIKGLGLGPTYLIHLGYSIHQSRKQQYIRMASGVPTANLVLIDEKYAYKDKARPGETPPWPCNEFYDLKAFRWLINHRDEYPGKTLFWNIG